MWEPVDTQFQIPQTPVSLVCFHWGPANGIRFLLESLNCIVLYQQAGTPGDLLKILSQGEAAPRFMILGAHGDRAGIHAGGEYAEHIDTSMLVDGVIPASIIKEECDLPGCSLINLSCFGAADDLPMAYLAGGLKSYIGCRTGVNICAMTVFIANYLYAVIAKKLPEQEAWAHAVKAVDHEDIWQTVYYDSDRKDHHLRKTGAK